MKLTKPWRISIELTWGCDNKCPMCFKQVLDKPVGNYNYMTTHTAYTIAKKIKQAGFENTRIEFALRGEPTLNPSFSKIIRIFRKILPQTQLTVFTNGNNLNPQLITKYFHDGVNIFLMDCYNGNINQRKKIYSKIGYSDYYNDNTFNPFHRHKPNTHKLVLMDDILQKTGIKRTRILHNQGGNVKFENLTKYGLKPLKEPYKKKCQRPFRELTIFYDGTIVLCCKDAEPIITYGNINKIPNLKEFWYNNQKLNIIRLLLYNKTRNFKPCDKCNDNGGMRIGFLPKMKILKEEQIKKMLQILKQNIRG